MVYVHTNLSGFKFSSLNQGKNYSVVKGVIYGSYDDLY